MSRYKTFLHNIVLGAVVKDTPHKTHYLLLSGSQDTDQGYMKNVVVVVVVVVVVLPKSLRAIPCLLEVFFLWCCS